MQRRQILRWGCGLMAAGASTTAWTRQPAAAPVWRERALLGLGTTLWLKAAHPSAERADAALDAAVRAIRDVERQMSLFNADSALQRLNAAGRLDRPEPALRSVLTLSREIARRSNGAFDISMQPLWQLWSAAAAQGALPSAQALQRTRQAVNWRALEVSTDAIRLNLRGMQLSLNGIAQGYAADSARDALIAHGIEHAWIDTGETALLGHAPANEPWTFGIEDAVAKHAAAEQPVDTTRMPVMRSDGRAIATSSDAHTRFSADCRHHHILDPRTGYSPTHWASVTVIARRCVVADALTKVFFMLPPSRVMQAARAWDVDVVLQDKHGQWIASPGAGVRLPVA
jgi:FAD:protein FMN transferase